MGSAMAAAFFASVGPLPANVKLPAIFGDHMVLQQGTKLPVWGTADAGESVTVTVGSESAQTTAAADGSWRVDLAPLPQNSTAVTMTVTGKNSVTFSDVLVGEVWVCSGQSNMEFPMLYTQNAGVDMAKANDPSLRIFRVANKTALDPQTDLGGTWVTTTLDSVKHFSAVAYFFGRDLRANLNCPVGLIGSYWGGTPAQAWTSLSGLEKEPILKPYIDQSNKIREAYPKASADYPAQMAAYNADMVKWNATGAKVYAQAVSDWKKAADQAAAAHQIMPPMPPRPANIPKAPTTPEGGPYVPVTLFNGMIAPLIPYAFKGAIWYQGESNAVHPFEYRVLFSRMITDWREKWGEGDFPFLFVQLARFKASPVQTWPFIREAQLQTLALPNTGMASAVDIGDPNNIHPVDKMDVGDRLALAARHVAYGQNLVYSGPIFSAMKAQGNAIQVNFTQTGGGLVIGQAPWVPTGIAPLPNTSLLGFVIAGSDYKWVPADATIQGDSVTVSSPQVSDPVAVRYAWANAPEANLYNKEGLPASPFRTDDLMTIDTVPAAPPK
jgi:sialate O-acetylesterase